MRSELAFGSSIIIAMPLSSSKVAANHDELSVSLQLANQYCRRPIRSTVDAEDRRAGMTGMRQAALHGIKLGYRTQHEPTPRVVLESALVELLARPPVQAPGSPDRDGGFLGR